MSLYETLGVAKTADDHTLKRAWRTLAQLHHPDRNPDDPNALERLAGINAAYAVLSDPEKRAQYDRYGEDAASAFFDPSTLTPETGTRSPPKPRAVESGEDLMCEVVLQAAVARRGGGISVTPRPPESCVTCQGTGWRRAGRACSKCEGGTVPGIGPYRMALPAGVRSGQVLRAQGYGVAGRGKGARRGDLYVTVRVPPEFTLEGEVTVTEVPCPAELLALGGSVQVLLPRGAAVKLRVRPATKAGQRVRLRGEGGQGRDLVAILVGMPTTPIDVVIATVGLG